MSFVPKFIQMEWSAFATMGAIVLGSVGIVEYIDRPSFCFELHKIGNNARIEYNYTSHPHIQRITHHNTECLVKKGYVVNNYNALPRWNGSVVAWIGKGDFVATQFIDDCKICNAYTEIDYDFRRFFGGIKNYDATKRIKWSNCHVRRELT
jgi:hypothetical protein